MVIKGIEGLHDSEIDRELRNGARFVFFKYSISIIFMTFKRTSNIYFIRANQSSFFKGLPFSILSFFVGWWGFPWGPIYTVESIFTNCSGGKDVTEDILQSRKETAAVSN